MFWFRLKKLVVGCLASYIDHVSTYVLRMRRKVQAIGRTHASKTPTIDPEIESLTSREKLDAHLANQVRPTKRLTMMRSRILSMDDDAKYA